MHNHRSDEETPAEALARLVAELVDEVRTSAEVTRYRTVKRGRGRTERLIDLIRHHTRLPGLIDQLHAIQSATRTIPVKIYRELTDENGKTIGLAHVRTEQRPAAELGVVTAGAAVPQGSPGWDADGALSPMPTGSSFESRPPATAALDLYLEIRGGLPELRTLLGATGRPPATKRGLRELVGLALTADEYDVQQAVSRLRAWASSAKILLGYEAPIVVLRDLYCRYCGGQLMVRADASSAVWCAGWVPLHGPAFEGEEMPIGWAPCGAKWPRGSWIALLEEMENGAA